MSASEAIPEVPAVLLGDVCEKVSAMHATNNFDNAHIRRNGYWQGNIAMLMLGNKSIKACFLDMSPNKVLVAFIDE